MLKINEHPIYNTSPLQGNDDDEFRFNDASTHEGYLLQNCELTWFCNETVIMMSYMHKNVKLERILNLKQLYFVKKVDVF